MGALDTVGVRHDDDDQEDALEDDDHDHHDHPIRGQCSGHVICVSANPGKESEMRDGAARQPAVSWSWPRPPH